MKKITLILIILISTLSCKDKSEKKIDSTKIEPKVKFEKLDSEDENNFKNNELKFEQFRSAENDELNKLSIDFDNYKLIINGYSTFNDNFIIDKDTLIFDEELGFNFENRLIEIQPKNKFDKFELFIALENNLTVYVGEKQFQELKNWKKIEQYEKLKDSSNFFFKTSNYNRKIKEQKLESDFEKIKREVLKLKGEYITEEINKADSINKLPIEFWISRVFLKIIRTKENGEKEQLVIINNSSWGC
ncbi:hypothetical protein [Algibacter luteus]|uniref:Lipoprotein n=1 Tax=Algibacter luteus TaxID=1178825 RepID=A0A1M6FCD7_9FLAO|nr:hypothetical protein [Algibacter luteus]SHI95332.1 hypothetical protein SAMN05216261_2316 [Algibacter luteus]